jgi:uncharacterized protein (TIGR03086 family)
MPTDLRPAAALLSDVVRGVSDEQLAAPTPSPGISVADLLDHLAGLSLAFTAGARKDPDPAPTGPKPDGANLSRDFRESIPAALDRLAAAWWDPAAWEGATAVGGVTMPGAVMGLVALDEMVLHGWDLARATDQDYAPDEGSVAAISGFLAESASDEGTPGLFGPQLVLPADAPAFDRALGLSGRNPAWRR